MSNTSATPSIFRQRAIERLQQGDRLDGTARVTRPLDWLALLAVLALVMGALLTSVLVEVPVKVEGRGLLIRESGLVEVVSAHEGRIEAVTVDVGTRIEAGAVVARLAQPELDRSRDQDAAALADLEDRRAQTARLHVAIEEGEAALAAARMGALDRRAASLSERRAHLARQLEERRALVAKGFTARNALIELESAQNEAVDGLAEIDAERSRVALERLAGENQRRETLLALDMEIDAAHRRLAQADQRLAQASALRSDAAGIVSEIRVAAGDIARPGQPVLALVPDARAGQGAGSGSDLQGLLYVEAGAGKRIEPGMTVRVAPEAVRREDFGFMRAEVVRVARLPSTTEGMRRRLKNDGLAQSLLRLGVPLEVEVKLMADASTPSGFAWSSSTGPAIRIDDGTLFTGEVVTRKKPLIGFLFPSVEQHLDELRTALRRDLGLMLAWLGTAAV